MRIVKARLRDAPSLAWVAAQAFAAEHSSAGVRRRAALAYPLHLFSVLLVTAQGQLWHWNRAAFIGIGRPGWDSHWTIVSASLLSCTGFPWPAGPASVAKMVGHADGVVRHGGAEPEELLSSAMEAPKRVRGCFEGSQELMEHCHDVPARHGGQLREHLRDLPEIQDRTWARAQGGT
ncbi:hypothetical protein [Paenarthrobacter sp. PH39-S1]|uniref:hypothetical protein n=1 Tax=Paenarthrobacter sp. PH39-S1 TaxID=3046204 RepID=UPI0024BAA0EB|nr:hypothetical protein [Paenarthrobacter sp. PH39-S1]MDJ0358472.1 hypothetical protein [Paenarthrobacter sp. PH39-S1]